MHAWAMPPDRVSVASGHNCRFKGFTEYSNASRATEAKAPLLINRA